MMFSKRSRLFLFVLVAVMILSQGVVFAEEDAFVVEINGEGVEKDLRLGLDDLKSMPEEAQVDEEYIYNSRSGQKSVDVKGVSLAYLLEEVGLAVENAEVIFKASDGYPIEPQTLEDVLDKDLKYVLAYEINGESIDNDEDPDNEEIVVYRKVKEEGEFGTVYKMVVSITVGEAIESTEPVEGNDEEPGEAEETEDPEDVEEIIFTDITEEYKYAETAIDELAKRGIVEGVGDDKFAPEREFTRAEFCKIVVESLGYTKAEYASEFTDVEADDWFAPYVQTAVDEGIFGGYPNNTFRPDNTITRQEMAAVAGRAAIRAEVVEQARMDKFIMDKSDYLDKETVADWAASEVAWLEVQEVFVEIAEDNFEPERLVNRAEAAVIVYNTLFK